MMVALNFTVHKKSTCYYISDLTICVTMCALDLIETTTRETPTVNPASKWTSFILNFSSHNFLTNDMNNQTFNWSESCYVVTQAVVFSRCETSSCVKSPLKFLLSVKLLISRGKTKEQKKVSVLLTLTNDLATYSQSIRLLIYSLIH